MRKMTKANLEAAFAGESQAHMKYKAFAEKARVEGFPNLSRLFDAISYAESVHAISHLRTLAGIGASTENLDTAIGGETYEVDEMYPAFRAVAELQDEKPAIRSMTYALEAEKLHAALYTNAKQTLQTGKDIAVDNIHICQVCGYTGYGAAPEVCPVCQAKKDKFRNF
jgi:rubrerythrin